MSPIHAHLAQKWRCAESACKPSTMKTMYTPDLAPSPCCEPARTQYGQHPNLVCASVLVNRRDECCMLWASQRSSMSHCSISSNRFSMQMCPVDKCCSNATVRVGAVVCKHIRCFRHACQKIAVGSAKLSFLVDGYGCRYEPDLLEQMSQVTSYCTCIGCQPFIGDSHDKYNRSVYSHAEGRVSTIVDTDSSIRTLISRTCLEEISQPLTIYRVL